MENKYIFANWKMHYGTKDALPFLDELLQTIPKDLSKGIVFCPPNTVLLTLKTHFGDRVTLAAQNCFYEEKGAFTGEVSPSMLLDAGARYVLVGHSERRGVFGETDEVCARKIRAASQAGIIPVLCVGEPLGIREKGLHLAYVSNQLSFLEGYEGELLLAYEPLWAIGTGKTASLTEITEMHEHIKKETADRYPLLYGGSVTPENARDILSLLAVDGVLVGGASLSIEKMIKIAHARAAIS